MLYTILGFSEGEFSAGLGWHHKMSEGFSPKSFWTMAKRLQLSPEALGTLVGLEESPDSSLQSSPLSPRASDRLFRIASAYQRMFAVLKDEELVREWLRSRPKELKGFSPLELLGSTPGSKLVMDAVSKTKPPKQALVEETSSYADSEDDDEDEVEPSASSDDLD